MRHIDPARRTRAVLVAASLVVGGIAVGAPAHAGPSAVTIKTLSARTVSASATAAVAPRYSARKGVRVKKATVDVRRGSAWMVKGVRQARVPAGSYTVTTKVTYRETRKGRLGPVRTARRTQAFRVNAAPAPTPSTSAPATTTTPAPAVAPVSSLASTSTSCRGSSLVKPDGTAWACTFDDEFDGTELDRTRWLPQQTAFNAVDGYQIGADCFVDDPDNVSVSGGALRLTVRKESAPFTCRGAGPTGDARVQHTAGSVSTVGMFAQARGRVEFRAAFPATKVAGHHGALWLYPSNPAAAFPYSGEIDVAEFYSQYPDRAIPYVHYGHWDPSVTNNYCTMPDPTAFNTYTLEWTPSTISIAYNGVPCVTHEVSESAKAAFEGEFMLVMTQGLGAGGNAVTSATPDVGTTSVDYVRVWK
ncbi:glycoside hydrolase family 16 protein [Aeromicrobium fastidiosum]|uniref:glycoside hydrolase family 16 protein n=1 Tax=Aeromicrobium fastidiosum TaxID=52699 RepID=UPI0020236653|nr:glycoside hydrolase family 16 protein [Aeromicrobium fastidiosum]MCL8252908.1 glycoside hydrolase family 16 protein [Aeromicrobium fastidiosum]